MVLRYLATLSVVGFGWLSEAKVYNDSEKNLKG